MSVLGTNTGPLWLSHYRISRNWSGHWRWDTLCFHNFGTSNGSPFYFDGDSRWLRPPWVCKQLTVKPFKANSDTWQSPHSHQIRHCSYYRKLPHQASMDVSVPGPFLWHHVVNLTLVVNSNPSGGLSSALDRTGATGLFSIFTVVRLTVHSASVTC